MGERTYGPPEDEGEEWKEDNGGPAELAGQIHVVMPVECAPLQCGRVAKLRRAAESGLDGVHKGSDWSC
jgi:hypothetical protein